MALTKPAVPYEVPKEEPLPPVRTPEPIPDKTPEPAPREPVEPEKVPA